MPDYGVSGPTRRYALIVGMLVALATVPTLVVLAVGAIWVGDRQSGGTPPRGASTGDPVIVLSPPSTSPRASSADSVAVPPAGPTVPPAAPRPAPVAVAAVPAPAPRRPVTEQATPAPTTPAPTAPAPTPTDPAPSPSGIPEPSASPTPAPVGSVPENGSGCRDRWLDRPSESVGPAD